ncbi:MAG TPA: hypothetical protein VF174_09050 [Micromonosporaceae bacterium]
MDTVPENTPKPLITDPVELAAAYGLDIDWSGTCTLCGGPIYDGQCYGAEQCKDPKCTRACCASKRVSAGGEPR